jgi:hypothetical protein
MTLQAEPGLQSSLYPFAVQNQKHLGFIEFTINPVDISTENKKEWCIRCLYGRFSVCVWGGVMFTAVLLSTIHHHAQHNT